MHAKIKEWTDVREPLIDIHNLSVEFQTSINEKTIALNNVNLAVNKDEFICVMGPSGMWKNNFA